jgi:glutamate carboxypeptidase
MTCGRLAGVGDAWYTMCNRSVSEVEDSCRMQNANQVRILSYLQDRQAEMTALLAQLVKMESPSYDKPALDRLGGFLGEELHRLNSSTDTLPQTRTGHHLRARWGSGTGGVLLLCHMDTVWEAGTLARRPIRIEDGLFYGPGAFDMKGGIVNALWAIQALLSLDLFPCCRVTLLITSDEEIGSRSSRDIIESEALRHDVVFVLEPAQPPHASLKTSRKGVGLYRVTVTGRSAHAGADHDKGINAIEELARQILSIQQFTNYPAGTTVNVGVVRGGTRSNVVPAHATARVDVRVIDAGEADRLDARMRGLSTEHPGASIQVSGGINRPPMPRTAAIASLYARAQALGAELGLRITESGSGGGSDGNFTAALGVPTLDGLGVVGDGGHSENEYVVLSSMPERAALLAALIREGGQP